MSGDIPAVDGHFLLTGRTPLFLRDCANSQSNSPSSAHALADAVNAVFINVTIGAQYVVEHLVQGGGIPKTTAMRDQDFGYVLAVGGCHNPFDVSVPVETRNVLLLGSSCAVKENNQRGLAFRFPDWVIEQGLLRSLKPAWTFGGNVTTSKRRFACLAEPPASRIFLSFSRCSLVKTL